MTGNNDRMKIRKKKYLGKNGKKDGPLPLAIRYRPTGLTRIATLVVAILVTRRHKFQYNLEIHVREPNWTPLWMTPIITPKISLDTCWNKIVIMIRQHALQRDWLPCMSVSQPWSLLTCSRDHSFWPEERQLIHCVVCDVRDLCNVKCEGRPTTLLQ